MVFRQSCIYGTRQFGQEDQGWVSWFVIAAVLGRPITIYGDGKQVRDLLWVDDLLDAYWAALRCGASGRIFNIGGGAGNTLSLLELVNMLSQLRGSRLGVQYAQSRPGDQPVYISDISGLQEQLQWQPRIAPEEGVTRLWQWVNHNRHEIESLSAESSANGAARARPNILMRISDTAD
jgi:CDP-paratose 2-epimerase